MGINALGMGLAGRAAYSSGKQLASRVASSNAGQKIANDIRSFTADNRGYVDLDAFKSGKTSTDVMDRLVDGSSIKTDDALDLAIEFLGEGYTEPVQGSGRFVLADGNRVFRIGENNILGKHVEVHILTLKY